MESVVLLLAGGPSDNRKAASQHNESCETERLSTMLQSGWLPGIITLLLLGTVPSVKVIVLN